MDSGGFFEHSTVGLLVVSAVLPSVLRIEIGQRDKKCNLFFRSIRHFQSIEISLPTPQHLTSCYGRVQLSVAS